VSEMIERVARAIFEAMDVSDGLDGISAERYARAAIEAIMEPTQAMYVAGLDVTVASCAYDSADEREIYQAMIKAALSETRNE